MMWIQKPNHPVEELGDQRIRTVELTGKRWKALIFVGDALLYGGVALVIVGVVFGKQWGVWGVVALVTIMMVIPLGALLSSIGRIGRWWYHS